MTALASRIIMERPRHVLIVDDSAVAREVLTAALRRSGFEVETATGGYAALQKIVRRRPDVVVLDLEMPEMSGLEFLERLMLWMPIPVVVCSSIAQPGAAAAIRALELGAVEVIPKPSGGVRAIIESDDANGIGSIVLAAAKANLSRVARPTNAPALAEAAPIPTIPRYRPATSPWQGNAIVVGASTGGTEALREILTRVPADAPPIVVVQHMPGAFTGAFAQRLDSLCAIEVREARDNDVLTRGVALIAPGGRHLELQRFAGGVKVRVFDGLAVSGHRPSVDVLFRSAARVLGPRAVGVLLTGMGADGAQGMLLMRQQGAHTIAQNQATCVVYGMPGEAVALGAVVDEKPIQNIAPAMLFAAAARADAVHNHETTTQQRLVS